MKKIYSLIFTLIITLSTFAQTGIGVTTNTSSPYSFTATNVDSTTTQSITLVNTVAAPQTVTLSGLSAPFTASQSTLTIPASDSISFDLSFNPSITGNFSDTLDWNGSVFGTGSLVISGEGVQVDIFTNRDTLNFGLVALGNFSNDSVEISNVGTGTMIVNNIVFDNTVLSTNQSFPFSLAQGASHYVAFTYTPLTSGFLNDSIIIQSNDPNKPNYTILALGAGISQISGNYCSDLNILNSPYTLVGDLNIADSCIVNIDPGVVINCNGFSINCNGGISFNGSSNDSIYINDIKNLNIVDVHNFDFVSVKRSSNSSIFENFENYSNGNYLTQSPLLNIANQTYTQITSTVKNKYLVMSTTDQDRYYDFGPFTASGEFMLIGFDMSHKIENQCNLKLQYRINGSGNFVDLEILTSTGMGILNNYERKYFKEYLFAIPGVTDGDNVTFRYYLDVRSSHSNEDEVQLYIDNFSVNYSQSSINFNVSGDNIELSNCNIEAGTIKSNDNIVLDFLDFEDYYYPHSWDYYDGRVEPHFVPATNDNYSNVALRFGNYAQYSNTTNYFETDFYIPDSSGEITISFDFRKERHDNCAHGDFNIEVYLNNQWTSIFNVESNNGTGIDFCQSGNTDKWYSYEYTVQTNTQVKFRFKAYSYNWQQIYYDFDNIRISNKKVNNSTTSMFKIENSKVFSALELSHSTNELNNVDYKSKNSNILVRNGSLNIDSCNLNGSSDNDYPLLVFSSSEDSMKVTNSDFINHISDAIYVSANNNNTELYNCTIKNNKNGITHSGANSNIILKYSFVIDNSESGIMSTGDFTNTNLHSSMISRNNVYGLSSNGQVNSNYSNITYNNSVGIQLNSNSFSSITNSIIWGNDITNYNQINTSSGITSIVYSSVQGLGAYGTSGSQYYFGDGSIDDDPVFVNQTTQHMSPFSNCVDAGTPWETDANMPYGLGGVRADIGIYGGGDNWFWGGTPVPDGSPLITAIEDAPQDQGGVVGVLFNKSVWDNAALVNNVTHYSIWRHYDINGLSVDSIENGNWERMGDISAQGFNGYAYSTATLGDSNLISGMFNSCYVVVAHTSDSSTYWYSNVLCGYSVDNLAPDVPLVSARIDSLSTGVLVHWRAPSEADYSYSNVYSLSGFSALGVIDTTALDLNTLPGGTYTYGVVHFDVNGNPSDTAWVTITIDDNEDIIPLKAGWNLISSNKIPVNNTMQDIFGDLIPGNLVYVTGFNQGSSLYNPNGLPFLNTLSQFDQGYGYWVKVNQADTLRIIGNNIPSNFKINLNAGWNLSGYVNPASSTPQQYLGDLISANNLLYCTSFDQGTQLFNPNGLPFLNTLNTMQRPFGYWIKVNNPVGSSQYRLTNESGNYFSPEYMFINGKMNLDGFEGNNINVYNSNNEKLAEMLVIKEGYLMTTPIYGDDPQTSYSEGFTKGENLIFELNGMIFESDITFEPNMELKQINLEFDENSVWNIYPNPTNSLSTISFDVRDETNVSVKVFDLTGKLLDVVVDGNYSIGNHSFEWNPINYDKGVYIFKIYFDQVEISSERVVLN